MQAPQPHILFSDEFEDPAFGERWDLLDLASTKGPAQWSVRDGILRQTSNCYTPNSYRGTLLITRREVEPPYRLRARMRSSDHDRMGLAFGVQGADEMRLFWMSEARRSRALVQVRGGRQEILAERAEGFQMSRWYDMDLLVTDDRVRMEVDGRPALDCPRQGVSDAGRVGLYAHANRGLEVARFRLERPAGCPTQPARLQWQVSQDGGRQTVVMVSNVSRVDAWVRAAARDQAGAPVRPGFFHGLAGEGAWRRLRPGQSGLIVLGPPLVSPGHGVCEIDWRTAGPRSESPILLSAYTADREGRGWSVPINPTRTSA